MDEFCECCGQNKKSIWQELEENIKKSEQEFREKYTSTWWIVRIGDNTK